MKNPRTIGILTGGGDCPGLNAVIRAVAKKAMLDYGMEIIGIEDSYEGLIQNRYRKLNYDDVSGILTQGGTILGTSKTANPYRYAIKKGEKLALPGFVTVKVQHRKARIGRNPQTGEPIKIPAKKVVKAVPAGALKAILKKK